jgi:hypothetical protein
MQVASELFTRFLLDFGHALFFQLQLMVQASVLNGHHRLVSDDSIFLAGAKYSSSGGRTRERHGIQKLDRGCNSLLGRRVPTIRLNSGLYGSL